MAHSLADVARRANVSQATASRVISNSSYPVSREARARVLAAVAELEYTPSALARALVTRRSRLLGIIVGDIVDPYFAQLARGVEDVARDSGRLTFVCNAEADAASELRYLQLLRDYRAEGVVFAGGGSEADPNGPHLEAAVHQAIEGGVRIISLASRSFGGLTVRIDNRAATADAARYLVGLGHGRIAYLEGPAGLSTSLERAEGFREAMVDAGLDAGRTYAGRFDYESGRDAARRFLAEGMPDAVVASSDIAAIGLLAALREAGVAVPGDVSIIGIDDIAIARVLGLTTIRIPMHELGATAARLMIGDGATPVPELTVLPHELVVRHSTAPARTGRRPLPRATAAVSAAS